MNKKRVVGISLIILSGLISLSNLKLSGAIIGTQKSNYLSFMIIGLFFIGAFLITSSTLEKKTSHFEKTDSLYYRRRANELTNVMGENRDSWISFYEANGILNELARKGYDVEHGDDMVAHTLSGKPQHVSIQEPYKGEKKHLFITKDPRDPRLKYVDIEQINGKNKRTPSSYHPKHARSSGKETMDYLSRTKVEGKG